MRKWIYLLVPFLLLAFSTPAQQKSTDPLDQLRRATAALRAKTRCKNLGTLGAVVDGAFDGQKTESRMLTPMMTDPEDSIWDTLIDCSEATTKPSERAEALRVAAMWEWVRAQAFRRLYLQEVALNASLTRPSSVTQPPTPE